ncbi:hypothetical protein D3H35_07020 [Cohnella faecalis]|uniref:Uncharacterized protein n=1 Tax=Cohnella faecalis TaxID=2315694 RepID=A0A398CZJ0_9BACL|nr:hypothetical protein D3H35_07020 [Cohnella faecalis]
MKHHERNVRKANEMRKQLWPIEPRPFGRSFGYFSFHVIERPEDVIPAKRVFRIEQAAQRLDWRIRTVLNHLIHHLRIKLVFTIKLTEKLVILYLWNDML